MNYLFTTMVFLHHYSYYKEVTIPIMARKVALTTFDNPYDPIDDRENWYRFDMLNNHDSSGRLARFAKVSDSLSDEEFNEEIERAIDEIVENDFENKFYKFVKETKD